MRRTMTALASLALVHALGCSASAPQRAHTPDEPRGEGRTSAMADEPESGDYVFGGEPEPMSAPESYAAEPDMDPPAPVAPSSARSEHGRDTGAVRAGATADPRMDAAIGKSAPRPAVLAGQPSARVRAGEWDDNANYREFQRYLDGERHLDHQRIDVSRRRFVVVQDANGKGVPNCRVELRDARRALASLSTTASGRAILFPGAVGLEGSSLTATAKCLGTSASVSFDATAPDGVVKLKLDRARQLGQRAIDIAFVLDTTGSMSEEIEAVKQTIRRVASELSRTNVAVRVALVEYKDVTDSYVTKVHPFSGDLDAFSGRVASIRAGGGGDAPEHVNEGLRVAIDQLSWDHDASARLAFVIGDAPPQLRYANDPGYAPSLKRAGERGIQLYTVAASGMDALGQVVWRQIAQYTGATNMFVLRGGAGPQSTGGGDPKSSCGGTHQNYSSGNLDGLIVDKVRLTLALLDHDPLRIAGLHQDENAKPCSERLVLAR